jgi:uncharacterized protein (TIGR02391 family)
MFVKELIDQAPTADSLLGLTEREQELVLLSFFRAVTDDSLRRMATCDGVVNELFGFGRYDVSRRTEVERAVVRAWRQLEAAQLIEEPDSYNGKNGFRVISAKGRTTNTDVDLAAAKVRAWLIPELVHAGLHGACLNAFRAGDYDTAVFEGFKAVEAAVRRIGGYGATDFGVAMMERAFDPTNGPLTDRSAPIPRRNARQRLFMGAMGELRNPRAHGDPTITEPRIAIEEILTASVLLRIVGA